jgi:hypothetical protein
MPVIGETNGILVSLIDRIRMLDNDMIRLQQKVSVLLQMQDEENVRKIQIRDTKNSKP